MIHVELSPGDPKVFGYRVAGRRLVSDRPLAWLAPFAFGPLESAPVLEVSQAGASGAGEVLFDGRAFLARRERQLICRHHQGNYLFEVEDLGNFALEPLEPLEHKGPALRVVAATSSAPEELLAEVLLGPLLALALATDDVFLLHGSAVELAGQTWVFLGESGTGKSTLAANLGGNLLADDQVAIDAISFEMLPEFPQPKLAPERLEYLPSAGRRRVDSVVLLEKVGPENEPDLSLLSPMIAAAGILRHTTAARCFNPRLLRKHLDFAAALVAQIPCQRLVYPHRGDVFPRIAALLAT